jgi:hypothetical protein
MVDFPGRFASPSSVVPSALPARKRQVMESGRNRGANRPESRTSRQSVGLSCETTNEPYGPPITRDSEFHDGILQTPRRQTNGIFRGHTPGGAIARVPKTGRP